MGGPRRRRDAAGRVGRGGTDGYHEPTNSAQRSEHRREAATGAERQRERRRDAGIRARRRRRRERQRRRAQGRRLRRERPRRRSRPGRGTDRPRTTDDRARPAYRRRPPRGRRRAAWVGNGTTGRGRGASMRMMATARGPRAAAYPGRDEERNKRRPPAEFCEAKLFAKNFFCEMMPIQHECICARREPSPKYFGASFSKSHF